MPQVLHNNYLMIRIDSYESDNTCSDWFCYHATSPCIFPAGFCEMNNITLTPPRGYEGQFLWYAYLKKTQATAAPPALFSRVSCYLETYLHFLYICIFLLDYIRYIISLKSLYENCFFFKFSFFIFYLFTFSSFLSFSSPFLSSDFSSFILTDFLHFLSVYWDFFFFPFFDERKCRLKFNSLSMLNTYIYI